MSWASYYNRRHLRKTDPDLADALDVEDIEYTLAQYEAEPHPQSRGDPLYAMDGEHAPSLTIQRWEDERMAEL